MPDLNERELGTILAALRWWQRTNGVRGFLKHDHQALWDVATDGGRFKELEFAEIDTLCEKLNGAGVTHACGCTGSAPCEECERTSATLKKMYG